MGGRPLASGLRAGLSRGSSRWLHIVNSDEPGSPCALSHLPQHLPSSGSPFRHTYSSYASGDSYIPLRGNPRAHPRGLVYTTFSKFPRWCESVFYWLLPLLIFFVLILLYSAGSLLLPKPPRQDYGIVIDAGSHGSRVNIFRWDARVYNSHNPLTGPVSLPKLMSYRVYAPGIEEAFRNPEVGREQLQQMLRDAAATLASANVQTLRWRDIPIYLKATAGMRIVAQERRDFIMRGVREVLHNKKVNPFRFKNDFARVISGEEEGVYGWVAVNSQRNSLGAPPEQTLGALDMGGSSSQITFSPFFTSILEDFNLIHLGNTSIRLYSHSFLGYGWADALARVNIRLGTQTLIDPDSTVNSKLSINTKLASPFTKRVTSWGKAQSPLHVAVQHPCFPVGHSFSFAFPEVNQEGLRLFVDLDEETLQALLKVMEVHKRFRDKIGAAAAPKGVSARHELQDEEGRGMLTENFFSENPKTQEKADLPIVTSTADQKEALSNAGGKQGKPQKDAGSANPDSAFVVKEPRNRKVKVKFNGSGNFAKCSALATE